MTNRRFISFSDEELKIMQNSIDEKKLQTEIKEEFKIRAYNRKQHEEWLKNRPTIYVC